MLDDPHNCCEKANPSEPAESPELFCPINAVLNLLNGRWTLHIIRELLQGSRRFNDIGRILRLNPGTLRERLRELEDEGIVTRTVLSAFPPHVEYHLTEKGLALNEVFQDLANWGLEWMTPPLNTELR